MSKGATSDIYSLGFILYEILLGWKAFRIEFEDVLKQGIELSWLEWHAALDVKARPLHKVLPGFPEDVSEAIAMMMEKRPEQRFQSLSAVAKALRRSPQPAPVRGHLFPPPAPKTPPQAQSLNQPKPEVEPKSPAIGGPSISPPLLAGGAVALLILIAVGVIWMKRTSQADPSPDPPRVENPKTPVVPPVAVAQDLPKMIDTPTGAMMLIPDGEFVTGTPGKTTKLPAFYLDKTEVTNTAYRAFCAATQHPFPKNPVWDKQYFDKAEYPVLNVSWNEARDFAAWAGKRLPTEEEWEKAARGPEGRLYPWGNWSQSTAANLKGTEDGHANTAPVGSFPYDESPFGILDMQGNVEEWSGSEFGNGKKVVRGGGFTVAADQASSVTRRGENPELDPAVFSPVGFRCAANPDAALKFKK
jgi:formylglycine-generating enzyme required for sulfatase activity